jgi:hypothetical protein
MRKFLFYFFISEGVGQKSLKNRPASPFKKDLSNETTFSPIHLAGVICTDVIFKLYNRHLFANIKNKLITGSGIT